MLPFVRCKSLLIHGTDDCDISISHCEENAEKVILY